jgi:hypothetical protein
MRAMRRDRVRNVIVGAAITALLLLLAALLPVLLRPEGLSSFELFVLFSTLLGAGLVLHGTGSGRTRMVGSALVGVSMAVAVSLIAGGVYLVLGGPPRPDRALVPEVVDVVVRWDFVERECQVTRVTLESGMTLDLRLLGDSRARCGDGPWHTGVPELTHSHDWFGTFQAGDTVRNGGLLYYGHDGQAEWIAGASSNQDAADSAGCPYTLRGAGFDEGDILHLSTGLVVRKKADFENRTPWMHETSTFGDSDRICVDRRGDAISIQRFSRI